MTLIVRIKTTSEDIDKIAKLLLTKKYSASQIARKLDRTKGSIMGLIWRTPRLKEIGLPNPPGLPSKFVGKNKPKPKKEKQKHEVIYLGHGPGPLVSLGANHCKFPLWSHEPTPDEPRLFCRDTKLAYSSYCDKHHKLCMPAQRPYVDKRERPRKAG